MLPWVSLNSFSVNLLLGRNHQAEIITVKRLSKDATWLGCGLNSNLAIKVVVKMTPLPSKPHYDALTIIGFLAPGLILQLATHHSVLKVYLPLGPSCLSVVVTQPDERLPNRTQSPEFIYIQLYIWLTQNTTIQSAKNAELPKSY